MGAQRRGIAAHSTDATARRRAAPILTSRGRDCAGGASIRARQIPSRPPPTGSPECSNRVPDAVIVVATSVRRRTTHAAHDERHMSAFCVHRACVVVQDGTGRATVHVTPTTLPRRAPIGTRTTVMDNGEYPCAREHFARLPCIDHRRWLTVVLCA